MLKIEDSKVKYFLYFLTITLVGLFYGVLLTVPTMMLLGLDSVEELGYGALVMFWIICTIGWHFYLKSKERKEKVKPKIILLPLSLSAEDAFTAVKTYLPVSARQNVYKIPEGLYRCKQCGEYKGEAMKKDLNWEGGLNEEAEKNEEYINVSCLCDGILCHKCKKNKIRRPISNSYDEESNSIWHTPYFSAQFGCVECREKRSIEEQLLKLNKEYPLVRHTNAGRLFSTVRRMKAEKEIGIPINYRSGFAISVKTGKAADKMSEWEWGNFYKD